MMREVDLGLFQIIKLKVLNLPPFVMVTFSCMVMDLRVFGVCVNVIECMEPPRKVSTYEYLPWTLRSKSWTY